MLAVPVRRAGRSLGVLVVQNRNPATTLTTRSTNWKPSPCCWPRCCRPAAPPTAERKASPPPSRAFSPATPLTGGIAIGPVVLHGPPRVPLRLLADNPDAELERLDAAVERMQRGLDELLASGVPQGGSGEDATASREILETYRLVAADAGWLRRVERGDPWRRCRRGRGAARRRRTARPHAPHQRSLPARAPRRHGGSRRPPAVHPSRPRRTAAAPRKRHPAGPPAGPRRAARLAQPRHRRRRGGGGQPRRPRRHPGPRPRHPRARRRARHAGHRRTRR